MSNVLNEKKKQQIIALGRLGWSLRRIQRATGVRRETAAGYLRTAGIAVRPPGGWGKRPAQESKPANEVITDPVGPKPANEVITDFGADRPTQTTGQGPRPYRELIQHALSRGRNAMAIWQDLVDTSALPAATRVSNASSTSSRLAGNNPVP